MTGATPSVVPARRSSRQTHHTYPPQPFQSRGTTHLPGSAALNDGAIGPAARRTAHRHACSKSGQSLRTNITSSPCAERSARQPDTQRRTMESAHEPDNRCSAALAGPSGRSAGCAEAALTILETEAVPDKYVATTPITFPFTSSERPVPRSGLSTAATFRNHLIEIGSRLSLPAMDLKRRHGADLRQGCRPASLKGCQPPANSPIARLDDRRDACSATITRKGGKVVTIPLAPRTSRATGLAICERTGGPVFQAADVQRLFGRHGACPYGHAGPVGGGAM